GGEECQQHGDGDGAALVQRIPAPPVGAGGGGVESAEEAAGTAFEGLHGRVLRKVYHLCMINPVFSPDSAGFDPGIASGRSTPRVPGRSLSTACTPRPLTPVR